MSNTHKQLQQHGSAFAMQLACAAGFLSDANCINHTLGFPSENPKSQWWCHTSYPPNPSELSAHAQNQFKIGCVKSTTGKGKSAAATWLQWTLGGFMVGRTTLRVCTRRFGANRLVNLKWEKGLAHWKLPVRSETSEVGMSEFIRPLVVVPLHVGGCQLDSSRVDHDNELHEENRGWDVTLIVGDQAETSTEQRLPPRIRRK